MEKAGWILDRFPTTDIRLPCFNPNEDRETELLETAWSPILIVASFDGAYFVKTWLSVNVSAAPGAICTFSIDPSSRRIRKIIALLFLSAA
jgi:hypothetical protein